MLKTTLTLLAVAVATPALAGDFEFDYHNHELETAGGAEMMFDRLESRVESFCTTSGRKPLSVRNAEKECMAQTLEMAVSYVDDPRFDRIYAQKSGAARYAGSSSDY